MILAQRFLTLEGARKRCAFENAHQKDYYFTILRFYKDEPKPDTGPFDQNNAKHYYWRIQKLRLVKIK